MDHLAAAASQSPAEFGDWLSASGLGAGEAAAALASLLEPSGANLAVKALSTGRYVYASAGMDRLFERTESTVVGYGDSELMRSEEVAAMRRAEQAAMAQRSLVCSEHRLDLAGRRREFLVARMALGSDHVMALWLDKTEERHRESHLQRALQQLEQQQKAMESLRRELQSGSGRDATSGLYMRAQFDDQLLREIDLSTREHREFALVLIALDPPAGPAPAEQAGERLLEALGRMLRANTRAMDSACRIGPQLFAVLLSGVGLATAHARMEQLRRQCSAQIVVIDGVDLGLSLSIGVASFPHTASRQDELLQASEAAVQEAQRRGGNQVVLASIPFAFGEAGVP